MTEAESLVLEHLRYIRLVIDETREDVREVKNRIGSLEREVAQTHVKLAEQSGRIDRLAERVERIERRLNLAEV
jgi:predicted  nucleic acid-binding Zn-ribbon protein